MPRRSLLTATALLALSACGGSDAPAPAPSEAERAERPAATPAARDESAAFLRLADEQARALLAVSPEAATALGLSEAEAGTGFARRLSDTSPLAREEAAALNERFLREVRAVDRDALSGTARVTYDVLQNAYEGAAQRNRFGFGGGAVLGSSSPYVVTQLSGAHIGLPRLLLTQQPLETPEDAVAYTARLQAMGDALRGTEESLRLDAQSGIVPPVFALEGAARSIDGLTAAAPTEHPLYLRLREAMGSMNGLTDDARDQRLAEAEAALTDAVYPAYAALAATLRELVPAAGPDAGVWRLEDGAAFYQHALDGYGAGGMSAGEIHELGLAEVDRISAEMNAILNELGEAPGETAGLRFAALAEDPNMVYPNTDEAKEALLASLREQVEEIDVRAPDWFGTLPPQPVEVRRIPVYEQDSAPGGYYTGPSLDGERPGIYWINLKDTADWPRYTLKTLTYHEAVPGHHFQIALQQAVEDMPTLRNMLYYSEFGEGWALYAERVAAEMGMYEDDPLGDLGRLQSELFRAARLVVDTGLHDKRWTREEAIDWMTRTTGETEASVTREVERYSVWPGQATSYKLGELRIRALRAEAEERLGEDFDIRAFHDAVLLDGSVPLPVLEAKIEDWIEARA